MHLRKTFRAPPYTWNSRLVFAADDEGEVFLNGLQVARCERWDRPARLETTVRLHQGENVIAVRARNRAGARGVLVHLRLGGEESVSSDGSWLASAREEPGWASLEFTAARWEPARVVAPHGSKPWGDVLARGAATAAESLEVPAGFRVDLLRSAEEGEGSWIAMAFDDRGRLIVGSEGEERPLLCLTLAGGRVERIEPLTRAVHSAMGLLWHEGALYANARGPEGSGLWRLEDRDGDDRFGEEEARLVLGYKGGGEHGYHALRVGPGGRIFILNGNGTRLPSRLSPASAHRAYARDVLDRSSDAGEDANELEQPAGFILRGPAEMGRGGADTGAGTGGAWELWMGGLRNAYDFDFDADGELFTFDSDMEWDWGAPWYRPTRVLHCVSGAEYGWREDRGMWPESWEDMLPAVADVGIGSPTGVEHGRRGGFPGRYGRALYIQDWSYGRILAVHIEPRGASFRGTVEPFLRGSPLSGTDLAFGPDGALYFITGGRGTQSGLYRVRWTGDASSPAGAASAAAEAAPSDSPAEAAASDPAAAGARALRRSLEELHARPDPATLPRIWPHLGSPDRALRYAARIALERLPSASWKERALGEPDPLRRVTALLALARVACPDALAEILDALSPLELRGAPEREALLHLRVLQVALARSGRAALEAAAGAREGVARLRSRLDDALPAGTWPVNRDLVRLLAWLDVPGVVPKALALIDLAATQEEQVHCVEQLRLVRSGWTPALRRRYFQWWTRPRAGIAHPPELARWFADVDRRYVDGAFLDRYLRELHGDAAAALGEDERAALGGLLAAPLEPALLVPVRERPVVRRWTMDDVVPRLGEVDRGRDLERGRRAYVDARCGLCHRMGTEGGSAGPELTAAARKYDRRALLESILEPSRAIHEQYRGATLVLEDGRVLTGRIAGESGSGPDGEVRIETNPYGGGLIEVARGEIAERRPSDVSLMPAGLADVLELEELLDLLAYLETGREAGREAGRESGKATGKEPGKEPGNETGTR